MTVLIANGAVKNSGDFLIKDSFLDFFNKNCDIDSGSILYSDLINQTLDNKTIIFSGGPIFEHKFQNNLKKAPHTNCNYIFFGAGSYLFNYSNSFTKMNPPVKLNKLAVRDQLTKDIFKLDNAAVTGCSASYLRNSMSIKSINKKIAISAPQRYDYFNYTEDLIKYLLSLGMDVSIFFNRGWDVSKYTSGLTQTKTKKFVEHLKNNFNINIIDSSGPMGMAEYDGYAMHIGFRLHSHYYFLQNSLPSKLLVEDSRGVGSNQLFGDDIIWPVNKELNVSYFNQVNPKVSAAIFRTIDALNVRSYLCKEEKNIISDFLNKPKVFTEKQMELESKGSVFLKELIENF